MVISDPSVSRFHAELQFNGTEWELVNLGKNGTLISSHSISRVRIDEQTLFRLGTGGPLLRFEHSAVDFDCLNTITGTVAPPQSIQIDESQKDSQVRAIVESEYFQHLQGISSKLRKRSSGIAVDGTRFGSEVASEPVTERQREPEAFLGRIISIHSFRGGTGKSNLTASLATTVACAGASRRDC